MSNGNERANGAVAWAVVGPDGETSIGGWLGMHTYETSLKWAKLSEGHSYAFAYAADDALFNDAKRYRWLRDNAPETWDVSRWLDSENQEVHVQDYLDEAIDAELEKTNDQ